MAEESDMLQFNDVIVPYGQLLNTDPPTDKLSASEKLIISDSNQTIKEGTPLLLLGTRKSSSALTESETLGKRIRTDSYSSATASPSSWEVKKMKIDLIAANAQIIKLEASVKHQQTIRKEMQILFEGEKASLLEQHKRDERALSNMEERLQLIRRSEEVLKDEYSETVKEHKISKLKWEKDKTKLQKQVAELKDKLLEENVSSNNQLSEIKKDMDELLQGLEGAQEEVEMLKKEVSKQTARAEQCVALRIEVEKKTFELQQLITKLKEIEYAKDSYKDWQQHAKTAQKRLTNTAELEQEVVRLRATERSLRDTICNELVLEEQVHLLTARVEALQPLQTELHKAKVKLASLQISLDECKTEHGGDTARDLSNALHTALCNQLNAVADCSQAQSQLAKLSAEVATLNFERDKTIRTLNDVQMVRENQESLIERLQRQLLLVRKERDNYRQQLDSYEKELTDTLSGVTGVGSHALLSARVEQLEKALQDYRDLLATQDHELQEKESNRAEASKYREEAEEAKREVSKLRAQRDQLQAHLEKLAAPTEVPDDAAENPAETAHKQTQVDLESAQEQIEKLKDALRESGNRACPEELTQLRSQLKNSQIELQRMKEELTSSAEEFKHVCHTLLGYNIEKKDDKVYRISNIYADSSEEYLTFTLCGGDIEMDRTDYTKSIQELVQLHLHQQRSIPVFLSALTMELFTRATMHHEVQEC